MILIVVAWQARWEFSRLPSPSLAVGTTIGRVTPLTPPPTVRGERRWPMAAAVVACGLMRVFLPEDFRVGGDSLTIGYCLVLLALLAVLIIGDPGRIDRQRPWLRATSLIIIALITLTNAISALRLIIGILVGAPFDSAQQLLWIGALIWATNVLTFALWYWDLDAGGAAARASGDDRHHKSFVFPEMTHSTFVPAGWYPQFVDYLSLSFNTALAFSPTDVSAIRRWAKVLMIIESLESLALGALVLARAVNILN